VRQVANRLQVTTTRHTIKLHARTQRVQVQVDARRIEQVLANLIGNAIKYSPDGGGIDIAVALDRPAGMARVTVTDHGIGVPREAQDQIFERFVRANNARERGIEGTGLGLFVCRAFVELHGGRIWLTSDEGQGTSFFVTLPLASRTTRRKRA